MDSSQPEIRTEMGESVGQPSEVWYNEPSQNGAEDQPSKSDQSSRETFRMSETSEKSLSRDEVTGHERILLCDQDGDLRLYCYVDCHDDDEEVVQLSRGIIFDGDRLFSRTFSYTPAYSAEARELIEAKFSEPETFMKTRFFEAYEGAVIRLFYARPSPTVPFQWYITTHRKFDAFHSKWACNLSFGEMMVNALQWLVDHGHLSLPEVEEAEDETPLVLRRFTQTLNPEFHYTFLLPYISANRVVCQAPNHPTIYHIGTFDQQGQLDLDRTCGLPRANELSFASVEELCQHVQEVDYNQLQGVVCFLPNGRQFKVLHPRYHLLFEVRGNEPSIKARYLQLRTDSEAVQLLRELYPDSVTDFEQYEKYLVEISEYLFDLYQRRFIQKETFRIDQIEHNFLLNCRQWWVSQPRSQRRSVSAQQMIEMFKKLPSPLLNRLIQNHKKRLRERARAEIKDSEREEAKEE